MWRHRVVAAPKLPIPVQLAQQRLEGASLCLNAFQRLGLATRGCKSHQNTQKLTEYFFFDSCPSVSATSLFVFSRWQLLKVDDRGLRQLGSNHLGIGVDTRVLWWRNTLLNITFSSWSCLILFNIYSKNGFEWMIILKLSISSTPYRAPKYAQGYTFPHLTVFGKPCCLRSQLLFLLVCQLRCMYRHSLHS